MWFNQWMDGCKWWSGTSHFHEVFLLYYLVLLCKKWKCWFHDHCELFITQLHIDHMNVFQWSLFKWACKVIQMVILHFYIAWLHCPCLWSLCKISNLMQNIFVNWSFQVLKLKRSPQGKQKMWDVQFFTCFIIKMVNRKCGHKVILEHGFGYKMFKL
jgi:hypothetical protein